jgi:hypothetical protein
VTEFIERLRSNGQALAERIRQLYENGTAEKPLFADPFKQEDNGDLNSFQNPKVFATFDSFGFSMGGLLNRAYQRDSFYFDSAPAVPGDGARRGRINRMVSLGTPHHGALQLLRNFGAGLGAVARFPVEPLMAIWSPGTTELLDYIDSPSVPCFISGNPFMCTMNRDSRSGPLTEASLIGGTKSVFGWGPVLFDAGFLVVPTALSDGVVPLSSAHGESTLSRRVVPALRNRKTFREPFDHRNAGTDASSSGEGNQRINLFAQRGILPTFQDHWVVRRRSLDPEVVAVVIDCPAENEGGHINASIAFDFKANNGGLTGIGLVTYGEDPDGEWHIIHGADSSSFELDSDAVLEMEGNSNDGRSADTLVLEIDADIEAGIDAQRVLSLMVTIGDLSPTGGKAEAELAAALIKRMEDDQRIAECP